MTPATLVRWRPRGPITFCGLVGNLLERERGDAPRPRSQHQTCCVTLDDGRACGLPAPYINFKHGGFVCCEHRVTKGKAVAV